MYDKSTGKKHHHLWEIFGISEGEARIQPRRVPLAFHFLKFHITTSQILSYVQIAEQWRLISSHH